MKSTILSVIVLAAFCIAAFHIGLAASPFAYDWMNP